MNYSNETFLDKTYWDKTDQVYRWKSSDNIPPKDILQQVLTQKELAHHMEINLRDMEEALNQYADNQHDLWTNPDREAERQEQLAEMRAAHGPGASVVNIITGITHKL